jgi:hypothetical protein
MSRLLKNYVTLYGEPSEAHQAMMEIILLYEHLNETGGPESVEDWKIGQNLAIFRLDPFLTEHWESPREYVSELSTRYPNAVIEWSFFGDSHEFNCNVFQNGHSLVDYVTFGNCRKLAKKSYYRDAICFKSGIAASQYGHRL